MKYKVALLIAVVSSVIVWLSLSLYLHQTSAPRSQEALAPPQPAVIPERESEVSFVAVGDIMLSRHVAERIEQNHNPVLPFSDLTDLLKSTDFNFGNLESPVSGDDKVKGRDLVFNTSTKHLAGLVSYNFKVVNLANNHAMDQGLAGLENTRRALSAQGISYLGVGDNQQDAWQPKIMTVNGARIGFLGASYASTNDGDGKRNDYVARIEDLTELKNAVEKLRSQAEFIVVTMHAGIEFKRNPDSSQIAFAHAAVDDGADLVIGAHPHWIQPVEQYKGKYIFYSLGNFVFDADHEDTREGLAIRVFLRVSKQMFRLSNQSAPLARSALRLDRIELIPVIIQQCSPRPATDKDPARILQKIGVTSNVISPAGGSRIFPF
jgi:poly-gamma-glutamate synthesis protein (capsule biosynthesis protein)